MTKTELEQQQHNAICAILDAFREYGYFKLFEFDQRGELEPIWDALQELESAAKAGGANYNDI